ncbi:MAG TPA: hypothetical protein VM118_05755, partial [Acidobacteriota bacterium]|nr:hypothetical protein [Acidobacteriota bacterium]
IEALRSELRRVAFEHETRFLKSHERRAEVIDTLYKNLRKTYVGFRSLTAEIESPGEPTKEEKEDQARESFNALSEHFWLNRLYLELSLCKQIEEFLNTMKRVFTLWQREKRKQKKAVPEDTDYWHAASEKVEKEAKVILQQLEDRFRTILGIQEPAEAPSKETTPRGTRLSST